MDAIEAIITRRSVRHFGPNPVPDEEVDILLRAAMQAPSAGNAQPWHFVVVTDRAVLDEVPSSTPRPNFLKRPPGDPGVRR